MLDTQENRARKVDVAVGRLVYPERVHERPRTRADCIDGPRPCPYLGCRYHLNLDVHKSGSIHRLDAEPWDDAANPSCALDLADEGPQTLEAIGRLFGVTRERVRQLQSKALAKLAKRAPELREAIPEMERIRWLGETGDDEREAAAWIHGGDKPTQRERALQLARQQHGKSKKEDDKKTGEGEDQGQA